jgi:uncharacterized protein YoaH (UPF0181 family)
MGLSEHLKLIEKGLSETDKQEMIERSQELQDEGMSEQEADRTVLKEMNDGIESDLATLKKQLKIKDSKK